MVTYGDFSSLLQLGVGLGIGLSVFRAPVDLRVSRITRIIDAEIAALSGTQTDVGRRKRIAFMDLRLSFATKSRGLENLQVPFMFTAVAAAALNLCGLIYATLSADSEVS